MAAQEDKLFEAKIEDCLRLGEKRPAFLGFLDLSERAYAEEYLRRAHAENYRFFGGFPEAERTVLGVFPDYMEPLDEEFPVTGLTVKFRRQDARFHTAILWAHFWHRAWCVHRSAIFWPKKGAPCCL